MPLSFSNSLSNALNSKINPNPLKPPAKSVNPFANPGKNPLATMQAPKVQLPYIGGQSTPATSAPANKYAAMSDSEMTAYLQNKNKTKPAVSAPTAPAGASYKGVAIKPGTDAEVAAQISAIDGKNQSISTPTPTYTPPAPQPQNTGGMTPSYTPPAPTMGGGGLYGSLIGALTAQALGNPQTGGIIQSLTGMGTPPQWQTVNGVQYNTAAGADPYAEAVKNLQEFNTRYAQQVAGMESLPLGIEEQTGRAQAYARQAAATQGALQQAIANVLEGRGQRITALGTAGGLANTQQGLIQQALQQAGGLAAPVQVPFTNQFISPVSGAPVQGGVGTGAGGTLNPINAIPQYAQLVLSGQISPTQAASALGNNPAFTAALNSAITQQNPNFNFVQAEANASALGQALAQATQMGGDLQKRGETVLGHIEQLQQSFKGITSTGVPALNAGLNILRSIYPTQQFSDFNTAIENVRGELAGIFAVGGTPTAGEAMARSILPDNITPNQMAGALERAKPLIEEKIKSYSTPTASQYGGAQTGGGTSLWDW